MQQYLQIETFSNTSSRDIDIKQLTTIYNMALDMFESLIPIEAKIRLNKFKEHSWLQLKKGGGTLYKCVSKVDKEYVNVDFTVLSKAIFHPNRFLSSDVRYLESSGARKCLNTNAIHCCKILRISGNMPFHRSILHRDLHLITNMQYIVIKKTPLEETLGRYRP